jgi:hypothetical protein
VASPYASATGGSSGGSPYLTAGGGSSTSSPYASAGAGSASAAAAAPSKKRSFLGDVGHFVASKAGLAGHDLKSIPGGFVQLGEATAHDLYQGVRHPLTVDKHPHVLPLVEGMAKSSATSLEHPLRDPFQTVVTIAPILRFAGGAAVRAGAAADAARAGKGVTAAVKAAAAKPELAPRLIRQGETQVPLHASKNPAVRLVQAGYDKVIQHALDTNPEGRVAAHASKRVGGALAETERYRTRMQDVPAGMVEHGGAKLGPGKLSPARIVSAKVPRKIQEAALRLTSENSTAEEAAVYHRGQAAKNVGVKANLRLAKVYDQVAKNGLLTQDHEGNVVVNAADHPRLAELDARIAAGQDQVDKIAADHGLMTDEQLASRRNGPARIRNGATYEAPTPGKLGVVSQGLLKQRAHVARLETLHQRSLDQAAAKAAPSENVHTTPAGVEKPPGPKTPGAPSALPAKGATTATTERLGAALSVERDRLAQMEAAAANRVAPTGVVGGAPAREGRGFVSYKTLEPRAPKNATSSAAGPVVGKTKSFIPATPITYEGLAKGLVPDNTSRLVARHMRDAYRYVNTDNFRRTVLGTGAAARRSSRDVLVREPDAETVDKLSPELEDLLGRKHSTVGELDAVHSGFEAWRQQIVPGLARNFADEKSAGIGAAAPKGYRWVDRNVLGDLGKPGPGPRGALGAATDKTNTAVTSATVYFKLGHIGTRVFTNAATNIIQGSATPLQIAKSNTLWHALTDMERAKALAASGQHSFAALPMTDESGLLSKGISAAGRAGAQWWAKHADAPFRFNSIAYEARKAGFDTPEKFKLLLDQLENPHAHNLNAAQAAKVDWIAKRANREGIAYDRLGDFERRYITRAFWFYPWTAGATRFAVNTLLEHPYKSAVIGNAGVQGRKTQAAELGDLPSYEQGLFRVAGSGDHPLIADFSTFSPFSTPAELLQTPGVGSADQFLNPAYAALLQLGTRTNQYGQHSNTPVTDAASSLFSPTPESQILTAYLKRHQDQSKRMFHTTWGSALARAAAGPGLPRRLNLTAAHSSAARERSGR